MNGAPSPVRRWIATLGGAGFLPKAPGTWGTAATAILLYPLLSLCGPDLFARSVTLVAATVIFSVICVIVGNWAVVDFGSKDPGPFVLDEAAGLCLTMLLMPALTGRWLAFELCIAFAAFRIFDVTKIPPARQLEHLPGGWGILMDDLAAAVYANVLAQIIVRLTLSYTR